jgi:tagatose 1,6-diphosphate aldolase
MSIYEKAEPEVEEEMAYYKSLPIVFDGFIDLPELSDGEIHLRCTRKAEADPVKNWLPAYEFLIYKGDEKVGNISLRIGYGGGEFDRNCYYGGQIGYDVDEKYRGNGYAGRACELLIPVAKAHNMTKLLITTNYTNDASGRVCEKLGARFVRKVILPEWTDLYKLGNRYQNIYEWSLS